MNNQYFINLLEFVTQLRILHWQTKSYAEHMALGSLYDNLSSKMDTLVETYSGKESLPDFSKSIDLTNYVSSPYSYLKSMSGETVNELETNTDEGIKNILADIINDINKTIYLLNLK